MNDFISQKLHPWDGSVYVPTFMLLDLDVISFVGINHVCINLYVKFYQSPWDFISF